MKLGPYHFRRDGFWKEVPQFFAPLQPPANAKLIVIRLLFEWPWQKKDPLLQPKSPAQEFHDSPQTYDDVKRYADKMPKINFPETDDTRR